LNYPIRVDTRRGRWRENWLLLEIREKEIGSQSYKGNLVFYAAILKLGLLTLFKVTKLQLRVANVCQVTKFAMFVKFSWMYALICNKNSIAECYTIKKSIFRVTHIPRKFENPCFNGLKQFEALNNKLDWALWSSIIKNVWNEQIIIKKLNLISKMKWELNYCLLFTYKLLLRTM
jgi:hypothetical protein